MKIIWLIGKSCDVDILWSAYPYDILESLENIRNTNLFSEINEYKYIFNKKDMNFFKNKHSHDNSTILVIKGISKFDNKIMNADYDEILHIDTMAKPDLFKRFLALSNISFEDNELQFIKKISSLEELVTLTTLKKLNIDIKYWSVFLKKHDINWNLSLKQHKLIEFGVQNDSLIIPIMIYAINSNYFQKPPLLFLNAKIKQGFQIWELNNLWKSLIKT